MPASYQALKFYPCVPFGSERKHTFTRVVPINTLGYREVLSPTSERFGKNSDRRMNKDWELSQEDFDALLDWLDPDREQAGIKYEQIRKIGRAHV